jgi:hypothetical protein
MARESAANRGTSQASRKVALAYGTALWAALLLALLEGVLATASSDTPFPSVFDYVRFGFFIAGAYTLLALAMATLEIPFVLLIETTAPQDEKIQRAARGYAAGLAIAMVLLPLEAVAELVRDAFARASFAGLAMALAGVGLALLALLLFVLLERVFKWLLVRAAKRGVVGKAVASSTAGIITPLLAIAVWGALLAAEALEPGSREAVNVAATAVSLLAIQGGLAWLATVRRGSDSIAVVGLAGAILALLAVCSLTDAALRAKPGDVAVDAVSQQTLLGSYVVPSLRSWLHGDARGPVILPTIARRPRPPVQKKHPTRPRAVLAAATEAVKPRPSGPRPEGPAAARGRSLLLVTFDAFDPAAVGSPDAPALQELAARSFQWPMRAPDDVPGALRELFGEGNEALGNVVSAQGYQTAGLIAFNAKGRGKLAPAGFPMQVMGGTRERNAADEAIMRARAMLREQHGKPWALWLHLPGPWARSQVARKAAVKRAGTRVQWLIEELRKSQDEERTLFVLLGLPGSAATPGVALVAEPGGTAQRGETLSPRELGAKVRALLGGPR